MDKKAMLFLCVCGRKQVIEGLTGKEPVVGDRMVVVECECKPTMVMLMRLEAWTSVGVLIGWEERRR